MPTALCAPVIVFELGRALEGEIQPKNQLSYKSKVPLLIDRFERH
jgi:hypothetical protein